MTTDPSSPRPSKAWTLGPAILVYNIAMLMALGVLFPVWMPLVGFSQKYRRTFLKRSFMPSLSADSYDAGNRSKPIWVHALSVGEVLSAEPLVKALARSYGAGRLIFTASTRTGFEMAGRIIAPHVRAVRHFPYDTLFSVDRALRVIQPRLVVIIETDLWPNFLYRLKRSRTPVYLVNARLSKRSFRGYRRVRLLMTPLWSVFERICVQTDLDRRRFTGIGVGNRRLATVGNIKFDQTPISVSSDDIRQLHDTFCLATNAPVWVAGSTHAGEEDLLASAFVKLRASGCDAVLIVAPRDPGRADDVCRIFSRSGVKAVTMDRIEKQKGASDVVVIDRIGILRHLYALADVTFVGGSLVEAGGHNPLEPASLAKPILFGRHTDDFGWICQTLEAAGGALRVDDERQLADQVRRLMADQKWRRHIGRCAYDVFSANRGAVARTLAIIGETADG
ncbi:MAG: 3-deoxy-D-manno-octulosonic acid transferase [Desulfosarcina sp.]